MRSFDNFLADMGEPPSEQHSIDRIDGRLGYFKENCRWATQEEQYANRRPTGTYEYAGVTGGLPGWARAFGLPYTTLRRRIERGWDFERALTTPRDERFDRTRKATAHLRKGQL